MIHAKTLLANMSTESAAGPLRVNRIVNGIAELRELRDLLDTAIAYGADMLTYMQTQYRDPTFSASNVVNLRSDVDSLVTWIEGAMPDDTPVQATSGGVIVWNTFSTAQLANFRTRVATFTAHIV